MSISLAPFQLRSFSAPESAAISAVRVSVPEEWLKALNARCAEVRAQIAAAEQAGLPVARAKQSLLEIERALRENRYSRAWHLAEGYPFKELARNPEKGKR